MIACFSLTGHGLHRERRLHQFSVAAGMSLQSCYLATIREYIAPQKKEYKNSSTVPCIRCRGNVFTKPLPSNDGTHYTESLPRCGRRGTQRVTQTDGRDLWNTQFRWAQVPWYSYIPTFIKIGSGIQTLMGGGREEIKGNKTIKWILEKWGVCMWAEFS
jgi:hypothetical protein